MFILYVCIIGLMFISGFISLFINGSSLSNKCLLLFFLDITIVGGILWVGPKTQGSTMYLINLIAWSAISLIELLTFFILSNNDSPKK